MLTVKLKIIGKYLSAIWIISLTFGSKQQATALTNNRPFKDFKAEAEVYSESQKTLRLKITWNPKITNDSTYNVLVQPIPGGLCHEDECNLHGQVTKNATLFVPKEPPSKYEQHYNTCHITPGCNYTIIVESVSNKFTSKLNYRVPDRVGNIYSCQHELNLPNVTTDVKIVSQILTVYWKVDEAPKIPSDIKVYIEVIITEYEAMNKKLGFYNHTLDHTKLQSGEFKWTIPSVGVHYWARIRVVDSNACERSPYTHSVYAPPPSETNDDDDRTYSVHVAWLIIGMSTTIIILVALLIYFNKGMQTNAINWRSACCRRRGRRPITSTMVPNPTYDILYEIPHSCLRLLKEIGKGAFGRVYLARAENICGRPGLQYVAVKQLKKQTTQEEKEEFLCEIQTMKKVSHPNIVALLGCCTIKEPLQMVMEYVGCGDLLKYLREVRAKHEERYGGNRNMSPCQLFNNGTIKISGEVHHPLLPSALGKYLDLVHSSTASTSDSSYVTETEGINLRPSVTETMYTTLSQNRDRTSSTSSSLEYVLDHKELHNFATQIAKGMKHLHENSITHRDLAARNILIDENKTLKISDFGLSRSGIYVNTKNKKVPLRWLSIEAIRDNLYSNKSDVWAFGIVLWEIGTLGGYPYPTINNNELLPYLAAGYRMEQPENCSKYLYELMLQCWAEKPDDRPGFSEILSKLEPVHQKIYVDFSELSSDYVFPPTMEQIQNNNLKTTVRFGLQK